MGLTMGLTTSSFWSDRKIQEIPRQISHDHNITETYLSPREWYTFEKKWERLNTRFTWGPSQMIQLGEFHGCYTLNDKGEPHLFHITLPYSTTNGKNRGMVFQILEKGIRRASNQKIPCIMDLNRYELQRLTDALEAEFGTDTSDALVLVSEPSAPTYSYPKSPSTCLKPHIDSYFEKNSNPPHSPQPEGEP